ncbi:MAG: hypothetical protein PHU25_11195 [Deltaproteobacteria bacterium]|nr:hypothetical protein [Deltaproteobacteria bacterium]
MSSSRFIAACVAAALGLGFAQAADAQSVEDWRKTEEPAQTAAPLVLVQSYQGVVPGSGNTLPRVAELKGKPGIWVTWPGFIMRADGGSRIFLQTTGALSYERTDKNKKIVLRFYDTKIYLSNNQNPLVTSHFNCPVNRAYLKKTRKYVELVLEMRAAEAPAITQEKDADGYTYFFVDFASGNFPPPPPPPESSARPSFSGFGHSLPNAPSGGATPANPPQGAAIAQPAQ